MNINEIINLKAEIKSLDAQIEYWRGVTGFDSLMELDEAVRKRQLLVRKLDEILGYA